MWGGGPLSKIEKSTSPTSWWARTSDRSNEWARPRIMCKCYGHRQIVGLRKIRRVPNSLHSLAIRIVESPCVQRCHWKLHTTRNAPFLRSWTRKLSSFGSKCHTPGKFWPVQSSIIPTVLNLIMYYFITSQNELTQPTFDKSSTNLIHSFKCFHLFHPSYLHTNENQSPQVIQTPHARNVNVIFALGIVCCHSYFHDQSSLNMAPDR